MTTREIFFKKLYEKSENYKIYVPERLTAEERNFIDKLSFFSKNDTWLKNFLCSSNKKATYKRQYLKMNSGYLRYNEFIELERCYENYKDFLGGIPFNFFMGSLFFFVIDILRLKMNYELGPIFKRAFIISFGINFINCMWYREKFYKPVLNYHYDKLSQRINKELGGDNDKNTDHSNTYTNINKEKDLVKNYFIKV